MLGAQRQPTHPSITSARVPGPPPLPPSRGVCPSRTSRSPSCFAPPDLQLNRHDRRLSLPSICFLSCVSGVSSPSSLLPHFFTRLSPLKSAQKSQPCSKAKTTTSQET